MWSPMLLKKLWITDVVLADLVFTIIFTVFVYVVLAQHRTYTDEHMRYRNVKR